MTVDKHNLRYKKIPEIYFEIFWSQRIMFLLILTTAVSFLGAFIPILIKPVSTKSIGT